MIYCINCEKVISRGSKSGRCQSCSTKYAFKIGKLNTSGKNNPFYKHGRTNNNRCVDCNIRINKKAVRCRSCETKRRYREDKPNRLIYDRSGCNNPNFGNGDKIRGSKNPFYNKHHTGKSKRKQSLSHGGTGIPGELSEYGIEFNDKLKERIRTRDNYTCQNCDIIEEEHIVVFGERLSIHHIDYNKNNNKEWNLITLCRACNSRVNFNRKYWKEYFDKTIETGLADRVIKNIKRG